MTTQNPNTLKVCFFDTETNGLPVKNDFSKVSLLELAWVITDIDRNIIKEGNYLVSGDFEVPEIITKLTGITKEKTEVDGEPLSFVLNKFHEDLKGCEFIIAHNLRFDYGMMNKEYERFINPKYLKEFQSKIQLDSLWMFRQVFNHSELENHKLQTIYDYLHYKPFVQTHRALDDVHMIISCMNKINNFHLMNYYWNKPLNFGKYKSKKLTYSKVIKKDIFYYRKIVLRRFHNINPFKLKYFLRI